MKRAGAKVATEGYETAGGQGVMGPAMGPTTASGAPSDQARHRSLLRLGTAHGTLYYLFWIFVIASVVGLWLETVVSYFNDGHWEQRAGLVWGPFSPIYGAGVVLFTIVVGLCDRKNPDTFSLGSTFLVSAVTGAGFEWFAGWFWEHTCGIVAWSYANQPFNIGGHTCLGMAVVWGGVGVLWSCLLPSVVRVIDHIPLDSGHLVTAALATFLVLDIVTTFGALSCWYQRIDGQPVETATQAYFAQHYDDDFMARRFETMRIHPELVSHGE